MSDEPWFPKLKRRIFYIATHYTWAFVVVMGITIVSCLFSIHYLSSLDSDLREVYENDIRGGDSIRTAYVALLGIENSVKDLMIHQDRTTQRKDRDSIQEKINTLKAAVGRSEPRFSTPKARQAFLGAKDHIKSFLGQLADVIAPEPDGKKLSEGEMEKLDDRGDILEQDFELLIANRNANGSKGIMEMVDQLRFSLVFSLVILGFTVVIRGIMYVAGHPGRQKKSGGPEDAG